LSRHIVAEFSDCNAVALESIDIVRRALEKGATAAGATILNGYCHKFSPSGVSGVLCLAESHISIHTWPESRYAAADIFTCGARTQPAEAIQVLRQILEAGRVRTVELTRGIPGESGFDLRIDSAPSQATESNVLLAEKQ
jgi:S-adenosylmethionine decarboxylase